jgi:hypothetical protein
MYQAEVASDIDNSEILVARSRFHDFLGWWNLDQNRVFSAWREFARCLANTAAQCVPTHPTQPEDEII